MGACKQSCKVLLYMYRYIWYVMLQLPWLPEYSCIDTYAVSPPHAKKMLITPPHVSTLVLLK